MNNLPSDPAMLLSFINMKLRDQYSTFDELCASMDIDSKIITDKLASIGYEYVPAQNQFK